MSNRNDNTGRSSEQALAPATERRPEQPGERGHTDLRTDESAWFTPIDKTNLESFEKKLQLLRDRVGAVASRYQTGLFLYGPGGVSKSFTVQRELERLQANYHMINSRVTGRGLFDTLEEFPDSVHVIEDTEQMFADKNAIGVLRSALWGKRLEGEHGPMDRVVAWAAFGANKSFVFSGGVIIIGNQDLGNTPEQRALRTRISVLHLQPTDNEMRAMMKSIAASGFELNGRTMGADECRVACDFVIAESLNMERPLDLRILIHAFSDYLQFELGDAGVHWRDAVSARIRERPTQFRHSVSLDTRAERKRQMLEIAREIRDSTSDRDERVKLWMQRTGKSQATLYRYWASLDSHIPIEN